jgi:hypothetical protein
MKKGSGVPTSPNRPDVSEGATLPRTKGPRRTPTQDLSDQARLTQALEQVAQEVPRGHESSQGNQDRRYLSARHPILQISGKEARMCQRHNPGPRYKIWKDDLVSPTGAAGTSNRMQGEQCLPQ